jgi:hypothetical protein
MNYNINKINGPGIIVYIKNKLFSRNPVFQASWNYRVHENYLICVYIKILRTRVFNVSYFFNELFCTHITHKLILNKGVIK